jgi:hypothetical protein
MAATQQPQANHFNPEPQIGYLPSAAPEIAPQLQADPRQARQPEQEKKPVAALERCIEALLSKRKLKLQMSTLCEKAGISRDLLERLLDDFPGVLAEAGKGKDPDPKVELAPNASLELCDAYIVSGK